MISLLLGAAHTSRLDVRDAEVVAAIEKGYPAAISGAFRRKDEG
jgi:hypothetical protein